jgi:hypothetical protein
MSSIPSATNAEVQSSQQQVTARANPESLVRGALDDIALIVGSAAALHQLDDDFVWAVMKRMDRVRVRLLRDLSGLSSDDQQWPTLPSPPRVHSAVQEFLVRNRAGMGERG